MAANDRFDEKLGSWLQAEAASRLPGRVLDATFERTRRSRQQVDWRGRLGMSRMSYVALVASACVVVTAVAAALVIGSLGGRPAVGGPATPDPRSAFLGSWVSTSDADGGSQVMTVRAAPDGAVVIMVTDDVASVCSGTPSTMTGTGRVESSTELVIPAPAYTCDDGREPRALSGPPLTEQLRDLTFVRDVQTERLTDDHGGVWSRTVVAIPSPEATTPPPQPSGAEIPALLNSFLEARIAGAGAQQYLSGPDQAVPLLYATTSGARYERAEFEQVRGIEWPYGSIAFKVRLFAGDSEVEQLVFVRPDRPLKLEYDAHGFAADIAPTTENGLPVAMTYAAFDDQVTVRAAHPWVFFSGSSGPLFAGRLIPEGPGVQPTTDGGQRIDWDEFFLIADPTLDATGCRAAPVDAKTLAARIRAIVGFGATAPVAVSVGGVQGFRMDLTIAAGTTLPVAVSEGGDPCLQDVLRAVASDQGYGDTATGERMLLYLLDMPAGSSTRTLAIEVVAPDATFQRAVEAAAPVVDSIEFHAP